MRTLTHKPDEVRELRRALMLTQRQFAEALGVSRRTVIRGEQRGLEIPYWTRSGSRAMGLWERWLQLKKQASERAISSAIASRRPRG